MGNRVLKSTASYHVTYVFQSESTLYSCLNVKELLARNTRHIWSLSDSNGIRTRNHLVRKRTLNHLAKLAENSWVFVYKLSGCGFESRSYHLEVNYFVWIHLISEAEFGDNPYHWWNSLPDWRFVIWIFWNNIIWRIQEKLVESTSFLFPDL